MSWNNSIYRNTPNDPKQISEILAKMGIVIPPPVNLTPTPDHPVQLPTLRNTILQVRTKPAKMPPGYKQLCYLNNRGFWEILCVDMEDIEELCRMCGLSTRLLQQKFVIPDEITGVNTERSMLHAAMPDIIYGVRVNQEYLAKAIKQTATPFRYADLHYKFQLNDKIVYLYRAWNPSQPNPVTDENMILARYTKLLMTEALDQEIIDWDTLPPEYKTMHSIYMTQQRKQFLETTEMQADLKRRAKAGLVSKNPYVEELITRIEQPDICREPENKNRKTFDFIELHICIKSEQMMPNRSEIIKKHMPEIIRIGLNKIASAHTFKRYGIPAQFLKATRYVITNQCELILTYELRIEDKKHE